MNYGHSAIQSITPFHCPHPTSLLTKAALPYQNHKKTKQAASPHRRKPERKQHKINTQGNHNQPQRPTRPNSHQSFPQQAKPKKQPHNKPNSQVKNYLCKTHTSHDRSDSTKQHELSRKKCARSYFQAQEYSDNLEEGVSAKALEEAHFREVARETWLNSQLEFTREEAKQALLQEQSLGSQEQMISEGWLELVQEAIRVFRQEHSRVDVEKFRMKLGEIGARREQRRINNQIILEELL